MKEKIQKFALDFNSSISFFADDFRKYSKATATEEDLKVAFIEPFLMALDIKPYLSHNFYFRREYKCPKGKPVDYLINTPCGQSLIEAKAPKTGMFGLNLSKEYEQILSYLRYDKINRGFLTNGNEWIIIDLKSCTQGTIHLFKPSNHPLKPWSLDLSSLLNLGQELLYGKSNISYESIEVESSPLETDGMKQVFTHHKCRRNLYNFEADYDAVYKNGVLNNEKWFFSHGINAFIGRRTPKDFFNGYYILTEHWYMTIGNRYNSFGSIEEIKLASCLARHLSELCNGESVVDFFLPNCPNISDLKMIYDQMMNEYNDFIDGKINYSFFGI